MGVDAELFGLVKSPVECVCRRRILGHGGRGGGVKGGGEGGRARVMGGKR